MPNGCLHHEPDAAGRCNLLRAAAARSWILQLLLLAALAAPAGHGFGQPLEIPLQGCPLPGVAQPHRAAGEAMLLVEIPAGSFTKYEIDDSGLVQVDRFLALPVAYPANYGALPGTRAGDGDRLDALVLTRAPLHPGVVIRFRPVGVLRMLDGGERDDKIIGVPAEDVDPHYADVRELADLPQAQLDRLQAFFRVYKDLPAGSAGNPVRVQGFGDAAEASALIDDSLQRRAASGHVASGCVAEAGAAG